MPDLRTVKFDEIDTPTEKERAEINEIQARTDATLVQAGVVAPDEVRQKLINSENSGYNGIDEEMQEEPFEDETEEEEKDNNGNGGYFTKERLKDTEGNGETQQNPFSLDKEWKESDHPRKENGQFGEGGSSSKSEKKPSARQSRVKNRQRKPVILPKEDMGAIHHNIETFGFTEDETKSSTAIRFSAMYGVIIKINDASAENLSYTIVRKWKLK